MLKPVAATFALGILAYSAPAGPAEQIGTTSCERRDAVLDYLSTKYAEAPVALGVTKNGSLVEVLTSGAGATFTIIVTRTDGTTCMVAAGRGWESLPTPAQPRI